MRPLLARLCALCAAVAALASCHGGGDTPPLPRRARRTVVLYMMADNSLSASLSADVSELAGAKERMPADCNVLAYIDPAGEPPVVYRLTAAKGLEVWKRCDREEDSADSLVMRRAVADITAAFPADSYGLVISSHGSGWVPKRTRPRKSIGQDNDTGSATGTGRMDIRSLCWTLAQLPRMDYVFFDACFMQSVEVAYEMRALTDWIIACPAEIPGPGAPYDLITPLLCEADIEGIVRAYSAWYPYGSYPGVLLSAVRCAALDSLAAATREALPAHIARGEPESTAAVQRYSTWPEQFTDCLDMRSLMRATLTPDEYGRWLAAFDRAVPLRAYNETTLSWFASYCRPARLTDPDHYGGITMYLPSGGDDPHGWDEAFRRTAWHRAAGWDTAGR